MVRLPPANEMFELQTIVESASAAPRMRVFRREAGGTPTESAGTHGAIRAVGGEATVAGPLELIGSRAFGAGKVSGCKAEHAAIKDKVAAAKSAAAAELQHAAA